MGINKFNSEGYHDPTTYEALSAIKKEERAAARPFRPLVYICSPFSGDMKRNAAKARRYSRHAVDTGYIPLTPHLLFPQFLDDTDPEERSLGLFFGNVLMDKCSEVWVFGGTVSKGMADEIARAKRKHIPLRYFTEDLKEESRP